MAAVMGAREENAVTRSGRLPRGYEVSLRRGLRLVGGLLLAWLSGGCTHPTPHEARSPSPAGLDAQRSAPALARTAQPTPPAAAPVVNHADPRRACLGDPILGTDVSTALAGRQRAVGRDHRPGSAARRRRCAEATRRDRRRLPPPGRRCRWGAARN